MDALLQRLRREGLLKPGIELEEHVAVLASDAEEASRPSPQPSPRGRGSPPHLAMLVYCDRGWLDGGLSVELGVRPDELIGTLCATVGGSARKVKVVDVREQPVFELRVRYGELEEPWEVEDLYALVHNLNDLLRDDPTARAIAVLGEWEDALQLWCVRKTDLPKLFRADYFAPRNHHQLSRLLEDR